MAILSTEHNGDVYEDTKPRWKNSLRAQSVGKSLERDVEGKPMWKPAPKATSPSDKSHAQGGSLQTQRRRPRSKSETRSRSPSPGLFGSTFASRAKQREAIVSANSRSRAPSVSSASRARSTVPKRSRHRSTSPTRSTPARKPSLPRPPSEHNNKLPSNGRQSDDSNRKLPVKITSELPKKSSLSSSKLKDSSNRTAFSSSSYTKKYGNVMNSEEYIEDSTKVHKFSPIWLAPSENPLEFDHFKKSFQDYSQDYSSMSQSSSSKTGSYKKSVSYADTRAYVSLGFRVL